jgi:hypothetical protein
VIGLARAAVAAAVFLTLSPAPALGQTARTAVIILATKPADQGLADDLTEVAMARVANRHVQVVGTREFRGRLGLLLDPRACLEDPACLGRVAVELVVTRILVGRLAIERDQYLFQVALWDLPGRTPRNRVFRRVEGSLTDLARNVQDATDALFLPSLEPGRLVIDSHPGGARVFVDNTLLGLTPLLSPELPAGRHRVAVDQDHHFPWAATVEVPPGQRVEIHLGPQHLPSRRAWPGRVAWATGAGAVVSAGAGVLLGGLAQVDQADATREEAMRDFQRRQRLGAVSAAALISSAVLAAVAVFHLVRYKEDIFGRPAPLP